jgi:hypothetical protein
MNYFIAYKLDSTKSFEKCFKTEEEMLEHVMLLADNDIGNYSIFEQVF